MPFIHRAGEEKAFLTAEELHACVCLSVTIKRNILL